MKKNIILILVVLTFGLCMTANAQEEQAKPQRQNGKAMMQRPNKNRQIKAFDPAKMIEMRTKHICNELMLSEEDAAKFSPVYKSYLEEMQKVFSGMKKPKAEVNGEEKPAPKELTDSDIDEMFKKRFENTAKINSIQESYYAKFRKILSAKQVARIFRNHSHEGVFMSIVGGRGHHNAFGHQFGKKNIKKNNKRGTLKQAQEQKTTKS